MQRTPFQTFLIDLVTVLTTLLEVHNLGQTEVIESHLYLGLDCDINRWLIVRDMLLKHNYITLSNHLVKLTSAGLAEAQKINDNLAKAKH